VHKNGNDLASSMSRSKIVAQPLHLLDSKAEQQLDSELLSHPGGNKTAVRSLRIGPLVSPFGPELGACFLHGSYGGTWMPRQ